MNVKEFYESIGVNYDKVLRRLQNDQLIEKYLSLILKDKNFENLEKAVTAGNRGDIFHAAHTIKGMALNLELTPLAKAAADLSDYLKKNTSDGDESIIVEKAGLILREFETIEQLLN